MSGSRMILWGTVGVIIVAAWVVFSEQQTQRSREYFLNFGGVARYTETPAQLAARKEAQLDTQGQFVIPMNFSFSDEREKSGISFFSHINLFHPAGQYDHGSALAVADVNGDGLKDIFFAAQVGGNELWINRGNGTFRSGTQESIAMRESINVGASFADFDNDGDQDVLITTFLSGVALFENDGRGVFTDITREVGLDSLGGHLSGATFLDYNNDGFLDIFISPIGKFTNGEKLPDGHFYRIMDGMAWSRIFQHPERAERPYLFASEEGRLFRDVTEQAFTIHIPWSGDSTFVDLHRDGYPDLYVMSMFGNDGFFENQGDGTFLERAEAVFGTTPFGSMGAKFFDYDNDRDLDLYVTDMHSDMAYVQEIADEKKKTERSRGAIHAHTGENIWGNAFYERQADGSFREVSDRIGAETFWPWGISVGDVNADGYLDVFVSAGMGHPYRYGINSMLLNNRGEAFLDAEFILGIEPRRDGMFDTVWATQKCAKDTPPEVMCAENMPEDIYGTLSSRSSVMFDIEGDGDLDIVTGEYNASPQVLMSDLSERATIHHLSVLLEGTTSNRDGLGAFVTVYAGDDMYTQYNDGKSGYLGQSRLPLYFGLGMHTRADRVEVLWPSGITQVVARNIPMNGIIRIQEPAS